MFFAEKEFGSARLSTAFESLPIPSDRRLRVTARFLNVSERTLNRWITGKSDPPRAVVYAVWHESPIGRAVTAEHSENGLRLWRTLATSQQRTIDALQASISRLSDDLARAKVDKGAPPGLAMNDPVFKYY